MSPTNIRKAPALLQHAGKTLDDQATIQPFNRPVYTVYISEFLQEDLNKYSKLFNHGIEGQWLSNSRNPTGGVLKVVDPSPPSTIPKISISWVLNPTSTSTQSPQLEYPLDFILVIQGNNALERSKVIVARSAEHAATSMLHEAMNGFSVVFTGALLRSDTEELFSSSERSQPFQFVKMPDVMALMACTNKMSKKCGEVRIIC
ncbi:MAG: hypothetical protein Q9208_006607 [Pyrenodesmia sp. 3 TL-2023]